MMLNPQGAYRLARDRQAEDLRRAELGRMVRKNRQGQSLRSMLSRASMAVRSLVL